MKVKEMREKGITLIALVVTIIILLILVGVTLSSAFSNNGLIKMASKATKDYKASSESEALKMYILSNQLDNKNTNLGEALYDKILNNGEKWNIVFTDDKTYGTGWNYIAKGTNIEGYGKITNSFVINNETGEIVELKEGEYDKLDYTDSVAVKGDLPLNIDASNLKNGNWEGIKKYGDVKYNEEKNALTFDGEGDYLELTKPGDFSNGFTFEIYMNLNRLGYKTEGGDGVSRGGFFCRIPSLTGSASEAMRFGLDEGDYVCAKFGLKANRAEEGLNFDNRNGGVVCKNSDGIKMNEDVYLTVVYQIGENGTDKVIFYTNKIMLGYGWYDHSVFNEGCSFWNNDGCPMFLGVCPWGGKNNLFYLKGDVYTVRLYNRALSEGEVIQNYDKTLLYREKIKKIN